MSTPSIVLSTANIVAFVADPLIGVLGLLMFRYPAAWAKGNARLSHKELHEFDSPKQLASTRRLGILFMIAAAFSFLSMLALKAVLVPLK
jgi:ABC-type transporter Mla maintaining outer membrane lipid asymmetry ATPase subunit MlaF